ncbi:hypothetical protein L4O78_002271 [Pseudomonas aeruginosa]|uniref:Uncharacterized protein n=7 Tax=Pseudomonas aeruginosa TaxID=287 RepID=A0A0Q3JCF6_PSEAI|nr:MULTISPECIES: hypothetical protein [Pseudomonas]WNO24991.1 hypothetical protein NKJIMNAM_00010 [Pseudomonas phage LPPA36]AHH53076.1 hypothetical protein AI22_27750 [Pseudomonas aeruginosa YL84]ALI59397.1 hypothetical protein CCBH4851_00699 [Pseudomonas aeruginosa]ANP61137.1 hypothetical protein A9P90_20585 [Pseudomonas aeruginosa]AOX26333.1 hypothetical protein PA1088_02206 [Pseudomonas aeruginosa]
MPEIIVTRPFNYREGLDATHYPASKGAISVTAAVAAHALGKGYATEAKAKAPPIPAASAEPAGGDHK